MGDIESFMRWYIENRQRFEIIIPNLINLNPRWGIQIEESVLQRCAGRKTSPVHLFVDNARKDQRASTVHGAYQTRVLCVGLRGLLTSNQPEDEAEESSTYDLHHPEEEAEESST